jgi:succinate dehydrogenase / fumarate reductase cytochrome b subunit
MVGQIDECNSGGPAFVPRGGFLAVHERQKGRNGSDWDHDVPFRDQSFAGEPPGMHVVVTIQLALRNKKAQPISYLRKEAINSSYASRTMYWSGPIVLAFIIFHLLQFTAGYIHPETRFIPNDVYHNLVTGFRVWWVSAWYVFAICLLGLHLRHGLWSMLQSVGLAHSLRKEQALKRVALTISILIVFGYISIPISILLGFLR